MHSTREPHQNAGYSQQTTASVKRTIERALMFSFLVRNTNRTLQNKQNYTAIAILRNQSCYIRCAVAAAVAGTSAAGMPFAAGTSAAGTSAADTPSAAAEWTSAVAA